MIDNIIRSTAKLQSYKLTPVAKIDQVGQC